MTRQWNNFTLQDVEDWFNKKKVTEITGISPIECFSWCIKNNWRRRGKYGKGHYTKKIGPACAYYLQFVRGIRPSLLKEKRREYHLERQVI